MAHKKGQGSSRNGRDSNPQYRGVKLYGGLPRRQHHRSSTRNASSPGQKRGRRSRLDAFCARRWRREFRNIRSWHEARQRRSRRRLIGIAQFLPLANGRQMHGTQRGSPIATILFVFFLCLFDGHFSWL